MTKTVAITPEVLNLIAGADTNQLVFLRDLINDRIGQMTPPKPTNFRVGQRVRFKPRKTKPEVFGTITSVNGKTCTVKDCTDGPRGWRVPPHMLTAA